MGADELGPPAPGGALAPSAGPEADEVVRRALAYPYAAPRGSYVFVCGAGIELVDFRPADVGASRVRTPAGASLGLSECCAARGLDPALAEVERNAVLAYGSNAAVEALGRKFAAAPAVIPVVRATLHDFDVVYSAHVSPYGAIGATLRRSSGTRLDTFVVHLTPAELETMHATEGNYRYRRLEQVRLELEGGATLNEVEAYVSRHGCLSLDGSPLALAARAARARRFPSATEPEALALVRDRLEPGAGLEDFVRRGATEPAVAAERTRARRATAEPLGWPTADARTSYHFTGHDTRVVRAPCRRAR